MGELIAVLSGKGGTGKTSVCAGVAAALAKQGSSVLCIDCDIGLRNLDIALGIADLGALSFQDVASGAYPLSMAAQHPQFPSLSFLTAPIGCSAGEIDTQRFGYLLQQARRTYEYVFLDAPAGIEAGFALAAQYADRIILVTGPDPAAIRDASRATDILESMGKKNVRLVVNRLSKKLAASLKLTVDDIMDQAGLPLLGIVPEDPDVMLAATFQKPLLSYTKKGAAAACRRIANRLKGYYTPIRL